MRHKLIFSWHYFELLGLWKVHRYVFTLPVFLLLGQHLKWNWTITSLISWLACLSCGKSVAETQLSIIWQDWLLPVMLINNEMGNLTACRSLAHAFSLTRKWNNLPYRWRIVRHLYRRWQTLFDFYTGLCFIPPYANTCHELHWECPCLRLNTSHLMWTLPLS